MQYRGFPKDDERVSEVGLGCWQIGGHWGPLTDGRAREILEAAVEAGVNFFDTADVYGEGRSERLIGDFLKAHGAPVFVATKVGRKGLFPDRYNRAGVEACIDGSLRRLGQECLDLVQLHCIPFEVMKQGAVWEWLRDFRRAGKIRRFGASVETVEEAEWCVDHVGDLYSLQVIFNIFRQKPVVRLFEKAVAAQVGILARVPLASGLLSGKFDAGTRFDEGDHRHFNRDGEAFNVGETFAGLPFGKGVELVEGLAELKGPETPLAQWALRWILDHEAVTTVIPGASSPDQARRNAAASGLPPLGELVHGRLRAYYHDRVAEHIRGPY